MRACNYYRTGSLLSSLDILRPGLRSWGTGKDRPRRRQLTSVSVGEGGDKSTNNHDCAANHDSRLTAQKIGHVGGDEEGDDGPNVEHVDHDAEKVLVLLPFALVIPGEDAVVFLEVFLKLVHLLSSVHQHAVVTRRGRSDEEEDAHEIELPEMRLLGPLHPLELRGVAASGIGGVTAGVCDGDHLRLWLPVVTLEKGVDLGEGRMPWGMMKEKELGYLRPQGEKEQEHRMDAETSGTGGIEIYTPNFQQTKLSW